MTNEKRQTTNDKFPDFRKKTMVLRESLERRFSFVICGRGTSPHLENKEMFPFHK